jgi:hypothetical protein
VKWRVSSGGSTWTVEAPGGREWTGAPSQRSALQFARSLAGIDMMLAHINQPQLAVVKVAAPPWLAQYGKAR